MEKEKFIILPYRKGSSQLLYVDNLDCQNHHPTNFLLCRKARDLLHHSPQSGPIITVIKLQVIYGLSC